jgi:hypothetical protein
MSNFNWDVANEPFESRFPHWAMGNNLWLNLRSPEVLAEVRDELIRLRADAAWGREYLTCPRVFVSHSQNDIAEALAIARIAVQEGFQFWLDVLDPSLTLLPFANAPQRSLLIAAIIEMALLNCTHVCAVMTKNTRGSMWVPYEYGRAKDSSPYSLQAACWIHPNQAGPLPEYLYLGQITRTTPEIEEWLRKELASWQANYPTCPSGAQQKWIDGLTAPLPS